MSALDSPKRLWNRRTFLKTAAATVVASQIPVPMIQAAAPPKLHVLGTHVTLLEETRSSVSAVPSGASGQIYPSRNAGMADTLPLN